MTRSKRKRNESQNLHECKWRRNEIDEEWYRYWNEQKIKNKLRHIQAKVENERTKRKEHETDDEIRR